jgi:hypothetical protein
MKKATSYICEHSAEFALIPELKRVLKKKYDFVTPVFPWLTREGSNISHFIHGDDNFHVLALYPRRPKVSSIDPPKIEIKINPELIETSKVGSEHGIPFMAGCPLASNFWSLGAAPELFWVKINENCKAIYTAQEIKHNKWSFIGNSQDTILETEEQLFAFVSEGTEIHNLDSFIEAIRDFRCHLSTDSWFFGGGYKPVYFLLK